MTLNEFIVAAFTVAVVLAGTYLIMLLACRLRAAQYTRRFVCGVQEMEEKADIVEDWFSPIAPLIYDYKVAVSLRSGTSMQYDQFSDRFWEMSSRFYSVMTDFLMALSYLDLWRGYRLRGRLKGEGARQEIVNDCAIIASRYMGSPGSDGGPFRVDVLRRRRLRRWR
jgi:hypothetical protein